MLKIHTLGGYNEIGKNMTAVEIDDDIIVFDCGLFLPAVIDLQESTKQPTPKLLEDAGALPDDSFLQKNRNRVKAFLITHAHLDHVGAVQHIAGRYPNADIYGTPYTIEVLKALIRDSKSQIRNRLNYVQLDSSVIIKGKSSSYKADFVNITHSTLQSTFIALHTKH